MNRFGWWVAEHAFEVTAVAFVLVLLLTMGGC